MKKEARGELLETFPEEDSPLQLGRFFETLYLRYDERFVTSAPDLASRTRRLEWADGSTAFETLAADYEPTRTS